MPKMYAVVKNVTNQWNGRTVVLVDGRLETVERTAILEQSRNEDPRSGYEVWERVGVIGEITPALKLYLDK